MRRVMTRWVALGAVLLLACAPRLQRASEVRLSPSDDEEARNRAALEQLAAREPGVHEASSLPVLPVTVVEPPLTPAEQGEGRIDRSELREFIEAGPHALLRAIIVEPVMNGEAFQGFRVESMSPTVPEFSDSGLRVGDIVTTVNGVDVSRPEGFMRVWDTLADADHLNVDIIRRGEARTLAWAIE